MKWFFLWVTLSIFEEESDQKGKSKGESEIKILRKSEPDKFTEMLNVIKKQGEKKVAL